MGKLKKFGKGIVLMHDFQHGTSEALPQLLAELKTNGYKIVHMTPKGQLDSLAQYDDLLAKDQKIPTTGAAGPPPVWCAPLANEPIALSWRVYNDATRRIAQIVGAYPVTIQAAILSASWQARTPRVG